jgi:non-specific serine/threonine protein kinase
MEKSGIYILEGLLKLRQICDSPALLPGPEDYGHESAKLDVLMELLEEITNNHKILVFSQFLGMLDLLRQRLEKNNITYTYLDGSTNTNNRRNAVDKFQEDEQVRVFLISLKAGGLGLNLTAADYVFLLDPWWNPAVEAQAIDRTHRIGQTRNIFAYKMVCKDSIEEKILLLQAKKKALAYDLVAADAKFVKQLTREDVAYLFT